ncbi:hypothetical protein FOL47_000210 [Perkinsus chesapeaki]|uniref:Peroxin domain-containing protein n=1 Tax=Perkinsus chesapeaki TaxID=330153 RepID=A0A7J6KXY3_PERCH|nr:hypothetical protein FOL47_000210 [Perkinsus chesapeaki]
MKAHLRVVDYLVSSARPGCLLPPVVFAELESTLTRVPVIDYHLDAETSLMDSPSNSAEPAFDSPHLRQRRYSEISVTPGEEQPSPSSDRSELFNTEVAPTLDHPVEIPLYHRKPRDKLALYIFHPETGLLIGETTIMKYDMRRKLPWTRDTDDELGGARWCAVTAPDAKQSTTPADLRPPYHYITALKVVPHLTGGLSEYFSPLSESQETTRRLEFEYFKTQISRFVKLIDLFQVAKAKYNDIVEWRWIFRSTVWLTYCTLLLVVVPQRCHWLLCVHLTLYCIYCNPAIRTGLSRFLSHSFDINAEYVKQRLSEVRPLSFLRASAQKDVQQIELTPLLIPEQEQAEGVEDTDYVSEIWENQRRLFGGKTFSAMNLLVMDRPRWSDVSGQIALDPPTSSANITWRIDVVPGAGGTDDNGWKYAWRWGSSTWRSAYNRYDFVRRRRWLPTIATSAEPAASLVKDSPPEQPSTPGNVPTVRDQSSAPRKDDSGYMRKLFGYGQGRSGQDAASPPSSATVFDYDLYDMTTEDSQPSLIGGVGRMWKDFREVAWKAQVEIAEFCEDIERAISLFAWRDKGLTHIMVTVLIAASVALYFVPVSTLLYFYVLSRFMNGFRRGRWKKLLRNCALRHILESRLENHIPSTTALSELDSVQAQQMCSSLRRRVPIGQALSVKVLQSYQDDEALADWLREQIPGCKLPPKWTRKDWVDNFIEHAPTGEDTVSALLSDKSSVIKPRGYLPDRIHQNRRRNLSTISIPSTSSHDAIL